MKKLLSLVVLGFLLSKIVYADNISDFQINGMSLGDSALEYYSKASIDSNKQNWYKGKKYKTSSIGDIQISSSYSFSVKVLILEIPIDSP